VDNWRYIVSTLAELKPGFIERNRENPLINKPAPTSSTNATASSDVTRIFRILCPIVLAVVLRPLSFRAPATSARAVIHTGAIPNTMIIYACNHHARPLPSEPSVVKQPNSTRIEGADIVMKSTEREQSLRVRKGQDASAVVVWVRDGMKTQRREFGRNLSSPFRRLSLDHESVRSPAHNGDVASTAKFTRGIEPRRIRGAREQRHGGSIRRSRLKS